MQMQNKHTVTKRSWIKCGFFTPEFNQSEVSTETITIVKQMPFPTEEWVTLEGHWTNVAKIEQGLPLEILNAFQIEAWHYSDTLLHPNDAQSVHYWWPGR